MNDDQPEDVDIGDPPEWVVTLGLSQYDDTTVDKLEATEPAGEVDDDAVEKIKTKRAQARLRQADQANDQRERFFVWVAWIVSGVVVAGGGVMAAYIFSQWHHLEPSVLISWFSAELVQTIGLAYIVAKYLFPPDGPDS